MAQILLLTLIRRVPDWKREPILSGSGQAGTVMETSGIKASFKAAGNKMRIWRLFGQRFSMEVKMESPEP